jgi:hypothetical protein
MIVAGRLRELQSGPDLAVVGLSSEVPPHLLQLAAEVAAAVFARALPSGP